MVSLGFFFFFLIFVFAVIGAMRGWAKELMVTFSVVLAAFIINVLERYVPPVSSLVIDHSENQFWLRTIILTLLVFFGYQTPNIPKLGGARFVRERLQDTLLGIFLGAINGYLIIGTLWYYLAYAGYPFPYITAPAEGTTLGDTAIRLLSWLPPVWLTPPLLYFVIGLAFLFVIVVFI